MNVTTTLINGINIGIEYLDSEVCETLEIDMGIIVDLVFFRFMFTK